MLFQILQKLQEKAACLIDFEINCIVVRQLFKDSNILKITDFMKYKYALFMRHSLTKNNITIFNKPALSLIRIMSPTQGDRQIRC